MTDEVNQLPSSPREDPSNPEDNSLVTVLPPVERDSNIMTPKELDLLRESYSFPPSVQIRVPKEDETIASTCSVALWRAYKYAISLSKFRNLFVLNKNPKSDHGWLYFKARSKKTLLGGYPNNVKGWKGKFFFALMSSPKGYPGPKVPRSWGTPDKKGLYSVPALLESKSFCRSFGLPKSMTFGEGDNGEDRPVGVASISSGDTTMSKRINLTNLAKKVEEKKGKKTDKSKGMCSAMTSALPTKGIIIREKHQRDEAKSMPNEAAIVAARPMAPREGTSVNPVAALGLRVTMLRSAATADKIPEACIPPFDKEKVDKLELNRMVSKLFHILGQLWSNFLLHAEQYAKELAKVKEERDASTNRLAKLELLVTEVKERKARAKKLAIEEFNSSKDF
ncbi:hypothetical protein Acr_16g0001190 [Actinidia rufa]|uniref:Uncharacterized protein n=1 Tax=Actinidia rufa TaxID=165716 RepID=A0A7J0FXT5_9ERIC|nr:hypothetical protein Acr_16g0001190 [Actinidia rufa]